MTFTGKAFSDDAQIKQQYIEQMTEHIRLDNLIQGSYKEQANSHWKGCAVTCLINPPDRGFDDLIRDIHAAFETEPIQFPEWIGRLIDALHEGQELADSQRRNIRLLKAIPVGFDRWDALETRYKLKIQRSNLKRVRGLDMTGALKTEVTEAISGVIRALKTGSGLEEPAGSSAWSAGSSAWSAARSSAWSAGSSAWSAARSAAESAGSAARSSAWSAESAAGSAAWSAGSAAWSAGSAARSAAWSAESAAESAAGSAEYTHLADMLIMAVKEQEENK